MALLYSLAGKALGIVFDTRAGRLGLAAAAIAGLFAWFVHEQRAIGEQRAIAKQERVDNAVRTRAQNAARRSADPAARGVQDPNRVD